MVSVAVPAEAPVMLTGVVEPKLKVGASAAPVGLEVIAAVSATLPVKPPAGVTVMVLVPAAPGVTVAGLNGEGESVNPGGTLTVSAMVVEVVRLPEVPVMVALVVPMAAVPLAVSVNTLEPVVGFVLHAAVTPLGMFKAVRVTAPAKPQLPVTETVLDVLSP
jgi:hypothetical protein